MYVSHDSLSVNSIPDSNALAAPRWLLANGYLVEGQRVVAALEPATFDSEATIIGTRIILESLEGSEQIRKRDLLTNGPTQHLRRTLIGVGRGAFG